MLVIFCKSFLSFVGKRGNISRVTAGPAAGEEVEKICN